MTGKGDGKGLEPLMGIDEGNTGIENMKIE